MVALVSGAAGTVAATALTVQAVDMSEVVSAETVVAAGTAEVAGTVEVADVEAAGTVEVAEVEVAGTVEVVEAFGRLLLCAMAGGPACSRVSAECFVVPAPFSGAGLL